MTLTPSLETRIIYMISQLSSVRPAEIHLQDRLREDLGLDSVCSMELISMLAEELSYEPYAMALPRGDSALRVEVNRALTQVYLGGEIETIFGQWLGSLGRPSGLLAAMYLLYSIPE